MNKKLFLFSTLMIGGSVFAKGGECCSKVIYPSTCCSPVVQSCCLPEEPVQCEQRISVPLSCNTCN
ncbi:hypothetical protein P618_200963 [Holospora obtusa F1]|uniref:Uncharacterized protein n=1 Tax=Holospora obtusa F1 TaxID=1399147 RepID=W6TDM6_HOLOB|nr:hypothetical protein [Holospora obtusa]ETZ06851.1 hypothetical protein P618_200963 [Holospora obtusa F1]